MPHIPLGASQDFKGKSAYGPYGDAIEEIDWSTGQILATLKELGLDDNTLVVFTSDNGPWVETTHGMKPDGKPFIPRDHSGIAEPLRGWKMSAWDGGCRVPFIARWPGKLKAGRVSDEILSTMDLLPTFAKLAGPRCPRIARSTAATPPISCSARRGQPARRLPLLLRLPAHRRAGRSMETRPAAPGQSARHRLVGPHDRGGQEPQLFDLAADPGETTNLAGDHPEIVARLMKTHRARTGRTRRHRPHRQRRAILR